MRFPDKAYDRLHSLWKRWGISQEDTYYAVENGLLRVCVWLPLRYMERGGIEDKKFIYQRHEHKEGFVGVRPEDFHRICNTGCAKLRIFRSTKTEGHILRMAYEPPQPAISVRLHDLVVLKEDRLQFETTYGLTATPSLELVKNIVAAGDFMPSPDYRHVTHEGIEYHFGDVQARIIEQLHDAAESRSEWVHIKTLLHGANSRAVRLSDVFKRKKWKQLIESNGRGYYRLKIGTEKKKRAGLNGAAMSAFVYLQELLDITTECLPIICAA